MRGVAEELEALLGVGGRRLAELLAVLLLLRDEGVAGRPRVARILGLGDRKARNLLTALRRTGLIEVTRSGSRLSARSVQLLEPVSMTAQGDVTVCCYRRPKAAALAGQVLRLRDRVAVLTGDPEPILVLGFLEPGFGEPLFPGVPSNLAARFKSLVKGCIGEAVTGVFQGLRRYLYCAALVQASDTLLRSTSME